MTHTFPPLPLPALVQRPRPARTVALTLGVGLLGGTLQASPAAAVMTTAGWDSFTSRTVASGWGTAERGGAWAAPTDAASSSVSSGKARWSVAPGKTARAELKNLGVRDVNVRAGMTLSAGVAAELSTEARKLADGSAYRATVSVSASGAQVLRIIRINATKVTTLATRTLSGTLPAGKQLNVELHAFGASTVQLSARAYPAGTALPDWQLSAADSSNSRIGWGAHVGVASKVVSTSTGAASTITVDDFQAVSESGSTSPGGTTGGTTGGQPGGPLPPAPSPMPIPSGGRGATLGTSQYPAPSGAVYVAPSGKDSNAGSSSAPLATVSAAISKLGSSGTVVVRGGTYHQTFTIPNGKAITVQNYPGETVWFDGSRAVSGFTASGSTWSAPWNVRLDSSPTYSWGAPDGTTEHWKFINPAYPMAAHPDQVWVGGTKLTQVGSAAQVTAGKFYADYAAGKLVIGNNPSGAAVVASDLTRAVSIVGANSSLRGLGFRNFAPSVPHQGAITSYAKGTTVENVAVVDAATGGIGMFGANNTARKVTVTRAGQLGVQGNLADGFRLLDSQVTGSNAERFNTTPAAGGVKFTSSRGVTVDNTAVSGSNGNGVWFDESSYDIKVTGNDVQSNTGRGIFIELSSTVVVADNLVTGNGDIQIINRNSNRMHVWNNTVIGSTMAIQFAMDDRTPANSPYALDSRYPNDPAMTFATTECSMGNNVVQSGSGANRIVDVEDFTKKRSGAHMVSPANGDVFSRPAGSPSWVMVWSRPGTDPAVYTQVSAFSSAQGQEKNGLQVDNASAVTSTFALTSAVAAQQGTVSQPLPSQVAGALGMTGDPGRVGAIR